MIPILRLTGSLACVVSGLLVGILPWLGSLDIRLLLLAAAAGVSGLFLLGFATNLVILHDIRSLLAERSNKPG